MTWGRYSGASTNSPSKRNANAMRSEPTDAERKLWWLMRCDIALRGTHFRRQMPVGPYIADFVCLGARLIVEVDREQHGFEAEAAADKKRTRFLEDQGYLVLRFWNRQVLQEPRMVLDTIFAALQERTPQSLA